MNIDWNVISSAATALGSVATAVGVCFGAWQIQLTKKQSQAEFEDGIDQQYRSLSMAIPVDVLIGKVSAIDSDVRELIYNYLDLSNEQIYLRSKGRISKHTWLSWSSGIRAHLKKESFQDVFEEVRESSDFTYLEKLVSASSDPDPVRW